MGKARLGGPILRSSSLRFRIVQRSLTALVISHVVVVVVVVRREAAVGLWHAGRA